MERSFSNENQERKSYLQFSNSLQEFQSLTLFLSSECYWKSWAKRSQTHFNHMFVRLFFLHPIRSCGISISENFNNMWGCFFLHPICYCGTSIFYVKNSITCLWDCFFLHSYILVTLPYFMRKYIFVLQ